MRRLTRACCCLVLLATAVACGDDSRTPAPPVETPDPWQGYVPDPTIVAKRIDAADFIDVPNRPRVVVNIVVIRLADGATAADATRVAGALGGSVVGQLPMIDLYEIEVPTTTLIELDGAIAAAEADPAIDSAGYNAEMDLLQTGDTCPAPSDIEQLTNRDYCPFDQIWYEQALTIFEDHRSVTTLAPITVGVVDSGLDSNPEFDDVDIRDVRAPNGLFVFGDVAPVFHGTQVTGMLAADTDGSGVNGIASRFLKDKLTIGLARRGTGDGFEAMAATLLAISAGAKVVNMSIGYNALLGPEPYWRLIWLSWLLTLSTAPDVLFVAAAPNQPHVLDGQNHAPAGLSLDNLISVGGSDTCDRDTAWVNSGRGAVDIAAPALLIPTIHPQSGVPLNHPSGNSIATPQVASLAAILRSMNPSLTPLQIRDDYIVGLAFPGPPAVSGRALDSTFPIGQMLIDVGVSSSVLDDDGDNLLDPPGLVMGRICAGLFYKVEGVGRYAYPEAVTTATMVTGHINQLGFAIAAPESDAYFSVNCPDCVFEFKDYTILPPAAPTGAAEMGFSTGDGVWLGGATSGTWTLSECRIDERTVVAGDLPMVVSVTGEFSASLELLNTSTSITSAVLMTGTFNLPFIANLIDPAHPTVTNLETLCDNGRP